MLGMFDPDAARKKTDLAGVKRKAQEQIKEWVMELLPGEMKPDIEMVACREFQCGDPKCAPIDTAIQVMFKEESRPPLQTGVPMESHLMSREDVERAVEELLRPELRGGEFDPISPGALSVYETLKADLFSALDGVGSLGQGTAFSDKLAITQRLFAALEDYEQRVMLQQQALNRAQTAPGANQLLGFAQQNKPEEIQRVLDETPGMDPSTGNSVGQTALHVACLWGNLAAADCLIKNNADVNKTNDLTGGTPLHIAVTSPKPLEGRLACAKLLLESGADPSIRDLRGGTPLAYAEEAEDPGMLALIKPYAEAAAGANPDHRDAAEDGSEDDMPALAGSS